MNVDTDVKLVGMKLVEIPYLLEELSEQNEDSNILIVGERTGSEGILGAVLERSFRSCVCTDIVSIGKDSILDKVIQNDNRVSFVEQDFVNSDNDQRYDYVICANVLEHFGMCFADTYGFSGEYVDDDYIRWNHDLRAIEKMVDLLEQHDASKIIITVPSGPPMLYGDIDYSTNNLPFLRRYDIHRIKLIDSLVKSKGMKLENRFFYSKNFNDWQETDISITQPEYMGYQNPHSPNVLWAFTIKHEI